MKNIMLMFVVFVGVLFNACKEENSRPSTIYITAKVTDKETNLPIDSVKVELYKSSLASYFVQDYYYTNHQGEVFFYFSPKDGFGSYYLMFYKDSFLTSPSEGCNCRASIDLDTEKQKLNIQLIKRRQ